MAARFKLTDGFKAELRQQFDAEEAELILDQESDAVALAVDLQDWEEEQTAILDAALEEDRQQLCALERERAHAREARCLSVEDDALRTSAQELESEAEQELALDAVLEDRAPKRRRREAPGAEEEWRARVERAERCEDAARLIEAEATAARLADRDQDLDAEMAAAAAELDESDRAEQAQIALLQLLREIRPRRYLLHAIRVGDVSDVVGCLRAQGGADPSREVNCCTPVWWAAYYGQAEVVRVLASHGAALDAPCTGPPPPLRQSRQQQRPSQLRLGPVTPLTIAAAAGDEAVVRALLECGASPDAGTYWDRWPLLAAAMFGHTTLCHILLQAGATANKKTRDGVGALWICANYNAQSSRQMSLVKALVLAGADLSGPRRSPMFSWCPIVGKLSQRGEAERLLAESGCRWPRFANSRHMPCGGWARADLPLPVGWACSYTHMPESYYALLSNEWIDDHLRRCRDSPDGGPLGTENNDGRRDREDDMARWLSPLMCARLAIPQEASRDGFLIESLRETACGREGCPECAAQRQEIASHREEEEEEQQGEGGGGPAGISSLSRRVFDLLEELSALPNVTEARQRGALAMVAHRRLGCDSPGFALPNCLLQSIAERLPGRASDDVALRTYRADRAHAAVRVPAAAAAAAAAATACGSSSCK